MKLLVEPTYFQGSSTGYQTGNVNITTVTYTPCTISPTDDTECEIIGANQINFSNVTSVTTSDRISSNSFLLGL